MISKYQLWLLVNPGSFTRFFRFPKSSGSADIFVTKGALPDDLKLEAASKADGVLIISLKQDENTHQHKG